MAIQEHVPGQDPDDLRLGIRSVAHDLRNLLYRLTLLSDSMKEEAPAPAARGEAREMLLDTTRRLAGAIDRLRQMSGGT